MTITGLELGQLSYRTDNIGQGQDALHLARSLSHQIPRATLHNVASGLSSEDAYRESMQPKISSIFTS